MTSPEAAPLAVEELERVAATMAKQPVSNTLLRLLATIADRDRLISELIDDAADDEKNYMEAVTALQTERDELVGKVAVLVEANRTLDLAFIQISERAEAAEARARTPGTREVCERHSIWQVDEKSPCMNAAMVGYDCYLPGCPIAKPLRAGEG